MKPLEEPARLFSGSDPELSTLLHAAQSDGPSAEQLSSLASRLGPILGGPPPQMPPPAGPGPGASMGGLGLIKTGAIVLAAAASITGGAYWASSRGAPAPSDSAERPRITVPSPSAFASVRAALPSSRESEAAIAPPPGPESLVDSHKARPTPSASANAPERPSEIDLLQKALGALPLDPAKALAVTQEHQKLYPRGALGQEREAIAIQALVRLGRKAEAKRRAEQFLKANPDSALNRRLEVILGPSDSTPPAGNSALAP